MSDITMEFPSYAMLLPEMRSAVFEYLEYNSSAMYDDSSVNNMLATVELSDDSGSQHTISRIETILINRKIPYDKLVISPDNNDRVRNVTRFSEATGYLQYDSVSNPDKIDTDIIDDIYRRLSSGDMSHEDVKHELKKVIQQSISGELKSLKESIADNISRNKTDIFKGDKSDISLEQVIWLHNMYDTSQSGDLYDEKHVTSMINTMRINTDMNGFCNIIDFILPNGMNIFHIAAQLDSNELFEAMLECYGNQTLQEAFGLDRPEVALSKRDDSGMSPADYAIEKRNVKVLDLCLEHDISLDVRDLEGNNTLHRLVNDLSANGYGNSFQRKIHGIRYILDNDMIDINAPNKQGISSLHCLLAKKESIFGESNSKEAIIRYFVEKGADINATVASCDMKPIDCVPKDEEHTLSVMKELMLNPSLKNDGAEHDTPKSNSSLRF